MAHWAVTHGVKVAIGVIVTAALSGMAWLIVAALKVPQLETQLQKHDEQLTTIRVSLLALMQKTGNPPDARQLEKLVSGVYELGEAKAELIEQAQLEKGTGNIVVGKWAPFTNQAFDTVEVVGSAKPLVKKKDIGVLFYAAMLSDVPASWKVKENTLKLYHGTENVYAFVPRKNVTFKELELTAAELNSLQVNLQELKKATPNSK